MLPLDRYLLLWGWLVGRGDPVHGSSEAREDLNDTGRMLGLREQLSNRLVDQIFTANRARSIRRVFASVSGRDQRAKGDCCLRGLMLDGYQGRPDVGRNGLAVLRGV